MSEESSTPLDPQPCPARIGLLGALIAVGAALWVTALVVTVGVIRGGWPTVLISPAVALAVTASVCAAMLGMAHSDRRAVSREHAELLAALTRRLDDINARVTGLEWQVCDRIPSDLLEREPVSGRAD